MPAILQAKSFKSAKRAVLNHRVAQGVVAVLLAGVIRFVSMTSKRTMIVEDEAKQYLDGTQAGLFAFWHGRMMAMPLFCPPHRIMHMLISKHRDGLLIARVIAHFGQRTVVGSSSRGGAGALREIMRLAKNGANLGITPDGPRGPAFHISEGTISIARLTGLPIIPVTFSSSAYRRLRSWDQFIFAKPFGHIFLLVGTPITVPRTSSPQEEETLRHQLEQTMQALTVKADAMAGAAA